jgi:hypothetical protein
MTEPEEKIKLFEAQQVRAEWDAETEKWWFSVVDVIEILSSQPSHDRARRYWSVMKARLKQEGAQPTTICSQLKLQAYDGKMRLTDVADTAQLLRIIQSVPSPKAEPFKQWLAQVGSERLDETVDPELSIDRAIQNYRSLGYSESWIPRLTRGMTGLQTTHLSPCHAARSRSIWIPRLTRGMTGLQTTSLPPRHAARSRSIWIPRLTRGMTGLQNTSPLPCHAARSRSIQKMIEAGECNG